MKILTLFLTIFTSLAVAEQSIQKTASEYIAVGYSDLENPIKAMDDACNRAKRELITYVFGATYQVNQNALRSSGVVEFSEGVSMNTKQVVLRGVIQEKDTGRCEIHYPIEEAELELNRLKSVKNINAVQFTDIGEEGKILGGVLEIVTIPDDVEVFIDGVRWGTTPLRLNQKLSIGNHELKLDHPQYQVVEKNIEIGRIKKTRLDQMMKRATGKITIETEPEDAEIRIDGELIGKSNIGPIEVLAGKRFVVEASHPDTENTSQTVTLQREEERVLYLNLNLRPGYIKFKLSQTNLKISVNDNEINTLSKWNQIEAGVHQLKIEKDGYEQYTETIKINAGEKKIISDITLEIEDDGQPSAFSRSLASLFDDYFTRNYFYVGFGYGDMNLNGVNPIKTQDYACCWSVEMAYQRNILSWFGIKLKIDFLNGGIDSGDMYSASYDLSPSFVGTEFTTKVESRNMSIGIPIQLGIFHIMPEFGSSSLELTKNTLAGNGEEYFYNYWNGETVQNYQRSFRGFEVGIESNFSSLNSKDDASFYIKVNHRNYEGIDDLPSNEATIGYLGVRFGF